MQQERYNIESGEEKAWRELKAADPSQVEKNSGAEYDSSRGAYRLEILGGIYEASVGEKKITCISDPGRKPEYFINLATPVYLVQAKPVGPSGELVKELKGGEFFFRGSHTLPLGPIAEKYGNDKELFIKSAASVGGTPIGMGDASFEFRAYPRIGMAFVLWLADEEFEARASLLFDSLADRHMALDAVWAVALVACQRLLSFTS
jgi:hypothetical protein